MKAAFLVLLGGLAFTPAQARVVTYPAPLGEPVSTEYQVQIGTNSVDVYTARVLDPPFAGKEWDYGGPYCFANLDISGPVEVRITSKRSLRDAVVRPASAGVVTRLDGDNTLILSLPGPRKLSIEPDGKKGPLLLFANALEESAPKPDAPGVIYFGPGVHKPGQIIVTNNQTLYLAGGAVVKGGIIAQGENIRITGRGILDGSDWEWRKGPTPTVVSIRGTNVEVSGITIRGASHWTVVPRDSQHVTVRGVKICGARVQNDDGINPCNSQDVLITDCFIRTDDDCVALKGLDLSGPNNNVERITVEHCTLWCDRARIFLLGHESRAPFMRDITLRDLDIIHFTMTAFLFEPGEEMRLENVTVENVRVHGEGQNELVRLKPVVNQYMRNKVPGYIRNVSFRNVTVFGKPGGYRVQMSGADDQHDVRGVTFENVEILGTKLIQGSDRFQVGPNLTWTPPQAQAAPGSGVAPGSRFDEKKIKHWTRKGALENIPARATDELPLSDQQNHEKWVKFEPMWDEFEGTDLNTNKWNVGMSWWRGRQPAWFNPTNVFVRDGQLHLAMRKEAVPEALEKAGYHDYTSAALHTRARSSYGYYEVKARAMNSGGSSSFWFQQEDRAAYPQWATEVDVFELCGKSAQHDRRFYMTLHVTRTPEERRHWQVGTYWEMPWRPAEAFHVYGFDWGKDELRWYVDGVLVHTVENTHWHQPLYLIFDSETMGEWFGMPNDADLPSTFSIEYVRTWKAAQP
jgi:beta-glucanase (GH16 family)